MGAGAKTSETVTAGDWTETQQRSLSPSLAIEWSVAGRDEHQVALADLLAVAGDRHRAAALGDDVDLLGLLVGVELLVDPGRDLDPGDRHVPRTQFPCVHEDVGAELVPLLYGSLREPPDQHAAVSTRPTENPPDPATYDYFTTRLTSFPGTTISFTTCLPSMWD